MIPKAQILGIATNQGLLPTTVQKDYVIGWLLEGISRHSVVSQWMFKGGTCLKKCYFETYRFSEDLDFTIHPDQILDIETIRQSLEDVTAWVETQCGLSFPRDLWKIEEYQNPRGNTAYQVRLPFRGPMGHPDKTLQRVKFDLTQDEVIANAPCLREIHSDYEDKPGTSGKILCYAIDEILAEKTRALFERNGRARDVYDVVNISRNFRSEIKAGSVRTIVARKFQFKGLIKPSVDSVLASVDIETLRANWEHQLGHQLTVLPPADAFIDDLRDAIAWWLEPEMAKPFLQPDPHADGTPVPRQLYPHVGWRTAPSPLDNIRYAARNNLCALVSYHGSTRLVEPYSLRYPATGNEILHVWEVEKNGLMSNEPKSFKTHEIDSASVSRHVFHPKWVVEL